MVLSKGFPSLKKSITSFMFSTPYTSRSLTIAASLVFCFGNINPLKPSSLAFMAIGKTPFMGCRFPSNESSPMIIYLSTSSATI